MAFVWGHAQFSARDGRAVHYLTPHKVAQCVLVRAYAGRMADRAAPALAPPLYAHRELGRFLASALTVRRHDWISELALCPRIQGVDDVCEPTLNELMGQLERALAPPVCQLVFDAIEDEVRRTRSLPHRASASDALSSTACSLAMTARRCPRPTPSTPSCRVRQCPRGRHIDRTCQVTRVDIANELNSLSTAHINEYPYVRVNLAIHAVPLALLALTRLS